MAASVADVPGGWISTDATVSAGAGSPPKSNMPIHQASATPANAAAGSHQRVRWVRSGRVRWNAAGLFSVGGRPRWRSASDFFRASRMEDMAIVYRERWVGMGELRRGPPSK